MTGRGRRPFFGVRPAGWLVDEPEAQAASILAWADHAERVGFEVLFVGDRLLSSASSASGSGVYEATMLDPFVLLGAIAGRTQRIRLATLVAVLPFRHPVSTAKITASLDVLSGGRLVLGAGSGWSAPELALFGIDRRTRGRRLEESIGLIRQLWTGEPVGSVDGHWTFDTVRVLPTTVQRPGPPVWLASFAPEDSMSWEGALTGAQRTVLDRIGRVADGWVPLTYSASAKRRLHPDQLAQGWRAIEAAALAAGRDPLDIEVIYPHWIAVVRDDAERDACRAVLSRFFTGTWEQARDTYLIGTPEEIAAMVRDHTSGLPRVDGYLFTPLSDDPAQLDLIATEVRPLLEG
jgi:probable F420-dependent oxidoreductase